MEVRNERAPIRCGAARQMPAILALLAGIVISALLAWAVLEWERREFRAAVAQIGADRIEALRGQIIRSMEVLNSIEALFNEQGDVSRQEFRAFVSGSLARQPEVQGLAWDPRVPASERAQWEARAHAEGFGHFRFIEEGGDGAFVPAGERAEYFPVYYMESLARNEPALGFDVASEPRRRAALERARDEGAPIATAPIRLAQESGRQRGFLVFLPVYRGKPASIEARREDLLGFAVAAFRVGDLVSASLRAAGDKGISTSISDAASGEEIYRDDVGRPDGMTGWARDVSIAGRSWRVVFTPTMAFGGLRFFWQSWATLGAGLMISGLLAAYLWSDGRRVSAIEARVREATRELSAEIAERIQAEEALVAARDSLELRVRERTSDLEKSNEALRTEVVTRKKAEAQAGAANAAKSDFLARMSHEIRTPLNAIMGYSEILQRKEAITPFYRDALQTIANSSSHLLHLINEILDLSKIDAGRMEVAAAGFDLVAIVNDLVGLFQPPCEEKRLGLRIEGIGARRSIPVVGDEGMLRQVLINLLANAVRFTDRGCVTLRVSDGGADAWRFEVEDTGIGVPDEIRERIFDPFQQGPVTGRQGGTGLGLTIASRQVELMGGRLELVSTSAAGSLFAFTLALPADESARPLHSAPARAIERLAPEYQVRALVVDDILENRELLSTMLAMIGCEIILAENGRQAIEAVRASRPDIVYLDMRLPEMDGFEAARRIVEEFGPAGIQIVATSASVFEHERERYMEGGCHDFVPKPFRADRIYGCLQSLLGVEFLYQETAPPGQVHASIDLAEIILPEDLATRLVMAAELHSATVLKSCLVELEALGPGGCRLAEHLRRFLASYDMEMIQRIMAQIPVEMPSALKS